MGLEGIEKFVPTPELQSEDSIGSDPLPAGQVWAISPSGQDDAAGSSTGSRSRRGLALACGSLNQSPPGPFRESVKIAEQNLYARAFELVGDRNPREHEFALQLRSFDAVKSGAALGVGVLISFASSLLGKPIKGGLAVVGGINLGGSIDQVHNLYRHRRARTREGCDQPADARRFPSSIDGSVRRCCYKGASRFLPRCCGCASEGGPRGLKRAKRRGQGCVSLAVKWRARDRPRDANSGRS